MSSKEVAIWLNKSYNTYRKNLEKYLLELSQYACFEKIYGGVIITEVIVPEYKDDKEVLAMVMESKINLVSASGMARKVIKEKKLINIELDILSL